MTIPFTKLPWPWLNNNLPILKVNNKIFLIIIGGGGFRGGDRDGGYRGGRGGYGGGRGGKS